jgi:F0F1-type ATP synthase delta subunit
MAVRLSRRKLATFVTERLLAGDKTAVMQLAAYLVETRRTRELPLVVRDIEAALAARGVVVADVATATPLGETAAKAIRKFIADQYDGGMVQLRVAEDASLLGGAKIRLPGSELDTTIRRKLTTLRANKI